MNSINYRPEIDGLRALAVLPVMLFHANLGCTGGFVGVDVFFVISGFLITSLILKDLNAGTFSLFEFWSRRVRRIIPAVTFVMGACLVAGWFIFWPQDFKNLGYSVSAQSIFLSNIFFWMQSGYFDDLSTVNPLLHTWSLSVEEQFYLVFPLALIAIQRFGSTNRVLIIQMTALASFCLSIYGSYNHPSATFYLIPTRAWELLVGALLAMNHRPDFRLSKEAAEYLSWAGLAMIAYAVFQYDIDTRFPGFSALLPVAGAILIIGSNTKRLTVLGKLLALRPLVFVGLISYSLYLWHWPLLVFSLYWSLDEPSVSIRIGILLVSTFLAAVSWKWVETPFRRRKNPRKTYKVLSYGILFLSIFVVAGLLVATLDGVYQRVTPEAVAYADAKADRAFIREVSLEDALNGKFVEIGIEALDKPIHTLIWGDSHAMAVMPVIDHLCVTHHVRCVGAVHSSTAPILGFASNTKF